MKIYKQENIYTDANYKQILIKKIQVVEEDWKKYSPAPQQEDLVHFRQVRVPDSKSLEQRC